MYEYIPAVLVSKDAMGTLQRLAALAPRYESESHKEHLGNAVVLLISDLHYADASTGTTFILSALRSDNSFAVTREFMVCISMNTLTIGLVPSVHTSFLRGTHR